MTAKLLAQKLAESERKIKAIYVGTYIPRECGIATFTKDLTSAINLLNPQHLAEVVAMNENGSERQYPWEVKLCIEQDKPESYLDAAEFINKSDYEVVNIQHEFGIYGGRYGEQILDFMNKLKKPVVITFHTILANPSDYQRKLVNKIVKKAKALIVMVNEAEKRLVNVYGATKSKIVVIPHGVPDIPFSPATPHKKKLNLEGRIVISTFGLLSKGKGIEYAIKAIPEIVKYYPNALYLVIGQTHPVIKKSDGEKYREELKALVKELGIEKYVKFVNRYLSLEELVEYIQATDVYVTPYLNPEQITSGTLAYAVGAGKPCVSTAYIYAQELLANGKGLVVPFRDEQAIAKKTISLLKNKEYRVTMAKKAYLYGRNMTWHNVALKYLNLFHMVASKKIGAGYRSQRPLNKNYNILL